MSSFSFSSTQRSKPNNLVSNNNIPTLNITTQNNYNSDHNIIAKNDIESVIDQKIESLITSTIPRLVNSLLDSKIRLLVEEKKLTESLLIDTTIEESVFTKEEIVYIINNRADALLLGSNKKTRLAIIFPLLCDIR